MTDQSAGATPPRKEAVLSFRDLSVDFIVDKRPVRAVDQVTFELRAGEMLAVVGESGSGKSVSSLAALGLLPKNSRVSGQILFGDEDLVRKTEAEIRGYRGKKIAMIFQDPLNALDPTFTVGYQLTEMVRHHHPEVSKADARARAVELLTLVDMPDPAARLGYYPHQLSGGQCQRVMIAMAISCNPEILIADEPTTALDVTVQQEVLDVLVRLRERTSTAVLLITHDMGVVADVADRVVVMRRGKVVEVGDARPLFAAPTAEYTRALLAAVPRPGEASSAAGNDGAAAGGAAACGADDAAVIVSDLVVSYKARGRKTVQAVDGVSLRIARGETFGVVGESGSGKSTLGKAMIGLAPITSGTIVVTGLDLATAGRREVLESKRRIGVVFQNPLASLNPKYTIGESIGEPLKVHAKRTGEPLRRAVRELLESVELPAGWSNRYPHELSGGQRQRVAIARAISLEPALLIADEPTSALDVSVQATVLTLIRELQERYKFACLFISHDLAVVDQLCDRIAVMKQGKVVETGPSTTVLQSPADPYTRQLVAAAPYPDPVVQQERRRARLALAG